VGVSNIYFELTDALNTRRRTAVLGSGQAVVHYRLAIMSKDGDWILREDEDACRTALSVLADRGARYRPGAPLDPRWLSGGWSSHLEFRDERGRRVRCDFFSRPPRIPAQTVAAYFAATSPPRERLVVGLEELILMKQTQRAKDYPIIGELARRLPPEREIELTTDPDRVLELAPLHGAGSQRPAVITAHQGRERREVVRAIADEIDDLQQRDRRRLQRYEEAAVGYLECFRRLSHEELLLPESHSRLVSLAESRLPQRPEGGP
jgi:hypothetical protein